MTKSDKDVQKTEEESVPLSTRDVELEPMSLRDIEMILAPGKAPPPLGNRPPPAKSGGARLELPKPARLAEADKAKTPAERPARPAGVFDRKPAQRDREDSATIDLDALVGGKKASAPPPLATNLDVVIAPREPRVPKPPPRAPLKNRASVPDDGPTALTKEGASPSEPDAKAAETKTVTTDAAASAEAPLEPKPAALTSSGPQAREDFVVDQPVETEAAATAPSTPPPSTPPVESAPPARPVLKAAPKPPRKVRTAEDEPSDKATDKATDEQPPKSRRSNRPRSSVAAKSVQPRARESAPPATEQQSRPTALYAAIGLLAAGGVLYAATRSDETPKAPAVATASPTSTATATQAASVVTPMPSEPSAEPITSVATTATSSPSTEPLKTATGTLPGLPPSTATAASTEPKPDPTATQPKPTATVAATTAPAGAPFDQGAAKAALGGAMGQATGCKAAGDPSGVARVSVTFAPSGRVTQAMVQGPPFAGTATGGCIARAFKSASVPPFSGDPVTVQKTVNMP
jgi:hypothetical protein